MAGKLYTRHNGGGLLFRRLQETRLLALRDAVLETDGTLPAIAAYLGVGVRTVHYILRGLGIARLDDFDDLVRTVKPTDFTLDFIHYKATRQ